MGIDANIHHSSVLELRLSRPEKKNALTLEMYSTLIAQLEWATKTDTIQAVCLSGEGDSFCAGNDIADFLTRAQDPDTLGVIVQFLHTLIDFPKPLLAAVQGDAVGIGATMLLHCDLVIAASDLSCRLPFTRLGLVPEGGSSLLLPQILGHRVAFELLVEGKPFDATCAQRLGLVNQIVTPELLHKSTLERAISIAQLPPEATRLSKRLLKAHQQEQLHAVIDQEARQFAARLSSPEAQAAFMAFLQAG
ncbi:enoyl-CoA hydratase-related protein [Marinobacterium marinum]|uniref:Enoyl-CoA hydratase/isomerase family protein n=1 Tax=Marinobacterium marinum TaxID=2756129 RepID=A0A7W1WY11_9GAMM|nr:enoyl-CoA hydratase-related protein [Marinobacterium marinum]MBA4502315.1 enoyl-CoA hydratase/isomerase family protein [Marinobacterium marinum]